MKRPHHLGPRSGEPRAPWLAQLTAALLALSGAAFAPETNAPADLSAGGTTETTNVAASTNVAAEGTNATEAVASAEMPELAKPAPAPARPTTTASAAATSSLAFEAYRIIAERNIFDPTRQPRSGGRSRPRAEARPARIDGFSLLGTLIFDKGAFAFFDGTDSKYRKVASPSDTIAGYKVARITVKSARLELNGQHVELPVGQQMRRQEDGTWRLAAGTPLAEPSGSGSLAKGDSESSASESSGDGDAAANDVLKRLMQQREKELEK